MPAMAVPRMKHLQRLLQDAKLRDQIVRAKDPDRVYELVSKAAMDRGISLSPNFVKDAFDDVRLNRPPFGLTEGELMDLGSSFDVADTSPKLCHTDSCGGHPTSCC